MIVSTRRLLHCLRSRCGLRRELRVAAPLLTRIRLEQVRDRRMRIANPPDRGSSAQHAGRAARTGRRSRSDKPGRREFRDVAGRIVSLCTEKMLPDR
jgi:hypothetical protein